MKELSVTIKDHNKMLLKYRNKNTSAYHGPEIHTGNPPEIIIY